MVTCNCCVLRLLLQDVAAVLAAEYPQGVDVVYEGVGGALRAAIMQHLAPNARVLQVNCTRAGGSCCPWCAGLCAEQTSGWLDPLS